MRWNEWLGPMQRLPLPTALDDWFANVSGDSIEPFELVLRGGRLAATPGLAFLAGYQAALRRLWPAAPAGIGALCTTEQHGLRPDDVRTRLEGLILNGRKGFVIAGSAAAWLLVSARDEGLGECSRLSLCVVSSDAPGVTIEDGPPLTMVPDIPHGRLLLQGASCQKLAGDGWHDYVKPFRTLEDLHVLAALVSWLHGVGLECAWPQTLQLRLIGLLTAAAEVSRLSPGDVSTHLLLAALDAQWIATLPSVDEALEQGPSHWALLWRRDRAILDLARHARAKRQANAAAAFTLTPAP